MVDLIYYCREGNRAKIHKAESMEDIGRSSIILKSLKCDQNFACSNICGHDEIIASADLVIAGNDQNTPPTNQKTAGSKLERTS